MVKWIRATKTEAGQARKNGNYSVKKSGSSYYVRPKLVKVTREFRF